MIDGLFVSVPVSEFIATQVSHVSTIIAMCIVGIQAVCTAHRGQRMFAKSTKSSIQDDQWGDIHDKTSVTRMYLSHVSVDLRGIFLSMIRVISFDTAIYSEVAGDRRATLQAVFIVLLTAFAAGVSGYFNAGFAGFERIISQMFLALVGWVLWVSIIYFVGTQIIRNRVPGRDWKSLARALGVAQSAGIIRILGVVPGLGVALSLVVVVWIFIASVLAIRGALEFESPWRAIGVVAIGLIPFVPVMAFLNLLVTAN